MGFVTLLTEWLFIAVAVPLAGKIPTRDPYA